MGIFDFLRKKVSEAKLLMQENASKSEEPSKENVDFDVADLKKLDNWLAKKKETLREKENAFSGKVKVLVDALISELKEELETLKNVDVESKKAEEKIKIIVRENLKHYCEYLEALVNTLEKIKSEKEIAEKISMRLSMFNKNSRMAFEKATILIGKELGNVRESISRFSQEFNKEVGENRDLLKDKEIIAFVEPKLKSISEMEATKSNVLRESKETEKSIENIREEIENASKKVILAEKSEEHRKFRERKNELDRMSEQLEKKISTLKESIDFRALSGMFHLNKKKMALITSYKENFKQALFEHSGKDILELLKEMDVNYDFGSSQKRIEEIIALRKEIDNFEIGEDIIDKLKNKARELELKLRNLNDEQEKEKKRIEKIEGNKLGILTEIKTRLVKG